MQIQKENIKTFQRYYELLSAENKKYNLTAITEREEIFEKHFLDSLSAKEWIGQDAKVLDIGSGAGFPGIPLKIERPDLTVDLMDASRKKAEFMTMVIEQLALKDIRAIWKRIEEFEEKRAYDCVVTRAVAKMVTLLEYGMPFLKVGGTMIAYKAQQAEAEAAEAEYASQTLGAGAIEIIDVKWEGCVRKLLRVTKIRETPEKYPRGKNKAKKTPLL